MSDKQYFYFSHDEFETPSIICCPTLTLLASSLEDLQIKRNTVTVPGPMPKLQFHEETIEHVRSMRKLRPLRSLIYFEYYLSLVHGAIFSRLQALDNLIDFTTLFLWKYCLMTNYFMLSVSFHSFSHINQYGINRRAINERRHCFLCDRNEKNCKQQRAQVCR